MRTSWTAWLGVVVLIGLAAYVYYPIGQLISQGAARGEQFHAGLPESYWIEVLNHHDDQAARNRAIDVLANMGAPIVPDVLKKAQDPKYYGRGDLYEVLCKMGEPAVPALMQAVNTDHGTWGICQAALAKIGAPAAPPLIAILNGKEGGMKPFATMVLYEMGEPGGDAVPALMANLEAEKPGATANPNVGFNLRGMYVGALGKMGARGKPAVPLLVRISKEPDHSLTSAAILALGDIGPAASDAVPDLIAHLRNTNDYISQTEAARALGRIGPAAKPAVPDLLKFAIGTKYEGALRSSAAQAVCELDPELAHQYHLDTTKIGFEPLAKPAK